MRQATATTILMLAISLTGCAAPKPGTSKLASWMTGSFDSAAQAQSDPAYFNISLRVAPIWTDRDDGPWLYVEQAAASALDRPYRQRVYRLRPAAPEEDADIVSEIYLLPSPEDFIAADRDPERFASITPESLTPREGCEVFLTFDGSAFVGATRGQGCESELAGAAYATSRVTLSRTGMDSWDQGFNTQGIQVWGAEAGPYEFRSTDP